MKSPESDIAKRALQFVYDCIREDLVIEDQQEIVVTAADILVEAAVGGLLINIKERVNSEGRSIKPYEDKVVESADEIMKSTFESVLAWANETDEYCQGEP